MLAPEGRHQTTANDLQRLPDGRVTTQKNRSTIGVMNGRYQWWSRRMPIGPDVPVVGLNGHSTADVFRSAIHWLPAGQP
jgi:hypothetical protein